MNQVTINGKKQHKVDKDSDGNLLIDDKIVDWDLHKVNDKLFHIIFENESFISEILSIDTENKKVLFRINGELLDVALKDKFDILLEKLGMAHMTSKKVNDIKAPMPGSILNVMVNEGDTVAKDQAILILEAMKMENVIKSPIDGEIATVLVKTGENVEKNHKLIEFKSE
ncbi:acetyl-CoA carboxylase biotin carboxyl carrier protein subunit [Hyphobacterium sp. CCMP332]|nr:acetyl-CoA carboxylase biotin carboxyl carrier protein subunit [Hyphobacterium sp. CCMP332]